MSALRNVVSFAYEGGEEKTCFCLKYSRELRIAAMPCRHSKYDADMERKRAAPRLYFN